MTFSEIYFSFSLCVWMYVFLFLCECMSYVCTCPRKPKEGIRSSGVGVTGCCEQPNMGPGNWIQASTLNCQAKSPVPKWVFLCSFSKKVSGLILYSPFYFFYTVSMYDCIIIHIFIIFMTKTSLFITPKFCFLFK